MYIDVLVELKAKNIDQTFTYKVPNYLINKIKIGIRVTVPFSKQQLEGFVMKINTNTNYDYEIKEIINIVDDQILLNDELINLGKYISNKTMCNLINAYQTMLPSALKAKIGFNVNKKYISYITLNNNQMPSSKKQKEIVEMLQKENKILKSELNKVSVSALKTLLDKEIVKEIKEETYRLDNNYKQEQNNIILNKEQTTAIEQIKLNMFVPYLLHGVTGSGKTEVYMNVIEKVLKQNKEAIVLVPEISLTPQLVDKFKKRFGSKLAILHSRLSNGEKYDEYRKIQNKEVSIVVGARSAIFAPLTNIGVIVIDEEHSSTYKQENTPRYNVADIALKRGKNHNCPVIFGSATPLPESYTRAKVGVYKLIELKKRVNNNLPIVTIIDMAKSIKKGNRFLSKELIDKINDRLNKQEQVIILLNRRGYSTTVTCHNCGLTDMCPSCDIPLIYHKTSNTMRCHYCGYGKSKLRTCPKCNSSDINEFGFGTQKLEEELNSLFNAKVIRMDTDTTSTKGSHETIIKKFENLEYDILIGTQMVAKGLDFPKVTLVGVVNGDSALNIPDYKSSFRCFELLNQVAGRAGRADLPGEVVIQTFNPNHYSIVTASNHDYHTFYNTEMDIRKKLKYPPFYNLLTIKLSSKDYEHLDKEANKIVDYLKNKLNKDVIVLGPSMEIMAKVNNVYYMQIIIKYKETNMVTNELHFIKDKYKTSSKMNLDIDFS